MTLQEIVDLALERRQSGAVAEAEQLYARALDTLPDHPDLLFNHGAVLLSLDRTHEALARFESVVARRPGDAAAWNSLGAALAKLHRATEAVDCFERALLLRPDDPGILMNKGHALMALRRFGEANAVFGVVARLTGEADAWHQSGLALRELARFDDALHAFDRAVALDPRGAPPHVGRGLVLTDLGKYEDALSAFDRALSLSPGLPSAQNNRGLVLQYLGRPMEARTAYLDAIGGDDRMSAAFLNYVAATTISDDDPMLAVMEAARADRSLGQTDMARLDLALAKAYGDLGRHEQSFHYMARGNALARAQLSYDEPNELGFFKRITSIFTHGEIHRLQGLGGGEATPGLVFIVGMPRSGTTLVEQIIASHPHAYGAGELTALHDAVRETFATRRLPPYPDGARRLDAPALSDIGRRYLALAPDLPPDRTHLIDKMPSNFLNLGVISAALPGAKIVHCVRDSLDTCFSRFAKLFLDKNPYSYDLGELGRYHRRYEALMAHWRSVLPAGALLEVSYEALVDDLEREARRMLEFCDLPWDDQCLRFHETQRAVKTPSALQVRQPLYRKALGRAAPYERFLGPLKAALAGVEP